MATGFDQLFAVSKALDARRDRGARRRGPAVHRDGRGERRVRRGPGIPGLPDYNRPGDDAATGDHGGPRRGHHGDDERGDDSEPSVTESDGRPFAVLRRSRPEAAAECFADLVSRGEIDQTDVPWWLQHIECGATDANWDVEYYTLPDDEFVALIDKAAPCYQALVDSGDVSVDVLPPEITEPRVPRRAATRTTPTTRSWTRSTTAPSAEPPRPPGARRATRP